MSQLALPLDESLRQRESPIVVPAITGPNSKGEERSKDEANSSEEIQVEALVAERCLKPAPATQAERKRAPATPRPVGARNGPWPAGLSWQEALAYTSLSAAELRRWHRAGALTVRRVGRNGAKVVRRCELDRLLEKLFAPATIDISEDFDFG